ncbi:hypothetical protein IT412_05885 [Candidatus Peregrinibacteria bacterium]|nr:hypothetical protein [Candidatus Peregrinibacteria bacterium]
MNLQEKLEEAFSKGPLVDYEATNWEDQEPRRIKDAGGNVTAEVRWIEKEGCISTEDGKFFRIQMVNATVRRAIGKPGLGNLGTYAFPARVEQGSAFTLETCNKSEGNLVLPLHLRDGILMVGLDVACPVATYGRQVLTGPRESTHNPDRVGLGKVVAEMPYRSNINRETDLASLKLVTGDHTTYPTVVWFTIEELKQLLTGEFRFHSENSEIRTPEDGRVLTDGHTTALAWMLIANIKEIAELVNQLSI